MTKLEKLIDEFLRLRYSYLMERVKEEELEDAIIALREKKAEEIVDEIKQSCIDELKEEARRQISEEQEKQKIKDIKSVVWQGFILAFLVGLAVNQTTELIGFAKGIITSGSVGWTWVLALFLLFACFGAYFFTFLTNALKLIKSIDKK